MFQQLKSISLIALLSMGSAAFAQDVAEQTEAITAGTLDMGTPTAELQPGAPYVKEKSGDWDLRCLNNPDGEDPCQLYQLLLDDQGNAVAEFSILPLDDGTEAAAGATIVAPLDTLLPAGVSIAIDGGQERRYNFTFCNIDGCVARVGFTEGEVDLLRAGANAIVTVVPANAQPGAVVALNMSLVGFTAGFEASRATLVKSE